MKVLSVVSAVLMAVLAIASSEAVKCDAKTPAPASGTTPSVVPVAADSDNPGKRTAGCGKPAGIKSGTFTVTINGKQRQYMVRVPENYDSSKPYRVIFTFHWNGSTMQEAAKLSGGYYGLVPLAKESTIFVAPQGTYNGANAGWPNSGGEDIALVDAINKALDTGLCVNPSQRFATGFSFGGAMSHSVACNRPDAFRGVAVLSGAGFSGCSGGGKKPVAYMGIHGVADDVIPISSGRQIRDVFVKANGCTDQKPPEPATGSKKHIKTEYKGCSANHPLVWIPYDGKHDPTPKEGGSQWAPTETWKFFTRLA